jgi:hypothetical protein
MSHVVLSLALATGLLTATTPALAQPAKASARIDPLSSLLAKLREPVDLHNADGEIKLRDLVSFTAERLGVPVLLGPNVSVDDGTQIVMRTHSGKLAIGKSLNALLAQRELTFLTRKDHLEIVTLNHAATETRNPNHENGATNGLTQPLISMVIKETPLNEAVAEIAEECDATVIVTPQAGDAKAAFVSARLLNVPLGKALELLALQCDLRVLKRGNAYVLTSADHANAIFGQKLERERQLAEVEKLKPSPFAPPDEKENKE